MHWLLLKTERFVDKIIPFALLLLFITLVLEFGMDVSPYQNVLIIMDEAILVVFIADLYFKYKRVKTTFTFFKTYWLEIIAVFPFYLIVRGYTSLLEASRGIEEAQKVMHEAALLREVHLAEEARFLREARILEEEARLAREGRLLRFTRVIQRGVRLLFGRLLFTHKLIHHTRKKIHSGR